MRRPDAGEQRGRALLQPDERQRRPSPRGPARPRPARPAASSGARASRMPRPMPVKASSARNSAVTSTTVEAVATDQPTPCSVTARAPNTKPPTWENGRQLADASRTMRPQTNSHTSRACRRGTMASQARPRMTNSKTASRARSRSRPSRPTARPPGRVRRRTSRPAGSRAAVQGRRGQPIESSPE